MSDTALKAAYQECRRIAKGHYENFPVGSVLLPRRIRPHFYALYAFMRTADDFADLPHRSSAERLALLADWRSKLTAVVEGKPATEAIFIALQDTLERFDLPASDLYLLLDAFEFDARDAVRFETCDDILWYTARSAAPVGRLVLALFGHTDAQLQHQSDSICTALQLINFIQDAAEDLRNERLYFPVEDVNRRGIVDTADMLTSRRASEVVLEQLERARILLRRGQDLPLSVRGRLRWELKAVLYGARAMVLKIESQRGEVMRLRPKLTGQEHRAILLAAIFGRDPKF